MPERRQDSTIQDAGRLTLATVDTVITVGTIKLATLQTTGIKQLLEGTLDPSVHESFLFKVAETGLSHPLVLGTLAGFITISLIEQLKALSFFKGYGEAVRRGKETNLPLTDYALDQSNQLAEIFGSLSESEKRSRRFSLKYAIGGGGLGWAIGMGNTMLWSTPFMLASSDQNATAHVALTIAFGFGTVFGYYLSRKFAYPPNN